MKLREVLKLKRASYYIVFLIVINIALILINTSTVSAQEIENESELYPKTQWIYRVYAHNLGYRVDYIKDSFTLGSIWIPNEWVSGANSIGKVVYGEGETYPYISFFFKEGKLDHFRIYLIENQAHPSWGLLNPRVDYSGKFNPSDFNLDLEF